jgi:hypothetical protein
MWLEMLSKAIYKIYLVKSQLIKVSTNVWYNYIYLNSWLVLKHLRTVLSLAKCGILMSERKLVGFGARSP